MWNIGTTSDLLCFRAALTAVLDTAQRYLRQVGRERKSRRRDAVYALGLDHERLTYATPAATFV